MICGIPNRTILVVICAVFFIGILLAIYALHVEPFNVKVTENTFDFFHSSEPLKIVLISDTQTAYDYPGYLEKVVAQVNSLDPDLILIGGDIVDGEPDGFTRLGALKELDAPYGVYAVLGNHDYIKMGPGRYDPELACVGSSQEQYAKQVERVVESFGINVFKNENKLFSIKGKSFVLVGLDDWWACKSNYPYAVENLSASIPQIILVHEQEGYLNTVTHEPNRALVLSGHTHCGQVRVPFIGSIPKKLGFEGDVDMGRGKLSNTTDIYVGCGVTPGRIRFGAPPEISVIYIR